MSDLLPCPFCGGEAQDNSYIRDGRAVSCQSCTARIVAFNPDANKMAIKAWNTRIPQWQDISTAPKDGTEIDILLNGDGRARIPNVKWGDDGVNQTWIDSYDNPVIHSGDPMNEITHWMPYPQPPQESQK